MLVSDLIAFEARMKADRGWKRKTFCEALGISQAKLRRHVEGTDPASEVKDRTLALACAAVAAELEPLGGEGVSVPEAVPAV